MLVVRVHSKIAFKAGLYDMLKTGILPPPRICITTESFVVVKSNLRKNRSLM